MLGDLRGIFLVAESVPSAARFRPHRNLVNPVNLVWSVSELRFLPHRNLVIGFLHNCICPHKGI